MKAVTIHGIDDTLANLITERAEKDNLSQNKTVKKLLSEALGIGVKNKNHDFSEFCGVWGEKDLREFDKGIRQFEQIDKLEWQ